MKQDSSDNPFCFNCGYDLSGLELPRPCPECGRLADPERHAAEARAWFARSSANSIWLVRPHALPFGVLYVLLDNASTRLARRLAVRWLWLPAALTVVTVGLGCFVTVEYDVKTWHYVRSDPQRRPVREVSDSETDRLFDFNLHLFRGGFFFTKPVSWIEVVERRRTGIAVSVPDSVELMFVFWGCCPLLVVVFGYWPTKKLVVARVLYRTRKRNQRSLPRAAETAWALIAVPLGLAVWVWFVAAIAHGICELFVPNRWDWSMAEVLLWAEVGWWVLVCLVGYGVLARQDRSRIVSGSRIGLWVAVIIVSLGGPAVVGWGLIHLLA